MQNFSLRYWCEIFYLICINSLKALRQDPPSQSDIYWLAGWTWLLRQFKISAWVRFRCRSCISPRNSRASNWVPRPENWKCISPEKLWAIFIHQQFRHIFHDFEYHIARFCLGEREMEIRSIAWRKELNVRVLCRAPGGSIATILWLVHTLNNVASCHDRIIAVGGALIQFLSQATHFIKIQIQTRLEISLVIRIWLFWGSAEPGKSEKV